MLPYINVYIMLYACSLFGNFKTFRLYLYPSEVEVKRNA